MPCPYSWSWKMVPGKVGQSHERQHDGNFREHADGCRECSGTCHTEQGNRYGHGQLKEIRRTDEPGRCRDGKGQAQQTAGAVGQAENQERLQDQRHGNQQDVQRILKNDLGL